MVNQVANFFENTKEQLFSRPPRVSAVFFFSKMVNLGSLVRKWLKVRCPELVDGSVAAEKS